MTTRDISRKEFLVTVGSFLGLFLLSRLPFGGGTKRNDSQSSNSYGNHVYGGQGK